MSNELATDLAAWCREQGGDIRPADLQRAFHFTWNWACATLERLEKEGELVRVSGPIDLRWKPAPAPSKPGRGYALPLSPKEHGALFRLLDVWFRRSKSPATAAGTYPAPRHGWTCFHCGETFHTEDAAAEHFGPAPDCTVACLAADQPLLRAIRARLKRPQNAG